LRRESFCSVTPSTRGLFRRSIRLEVQQDLWEQGSLIFSCSGRLCRGAVTSGASLLVQINGFFVDFIDFVSTYLHLQSYSFAVQFERQVHRYTDKFHDVQDDSADLRRNDRRTSVIDLEYRPPECETIRLVRESVCILYQGPYSSSRGVHETFRAVPVW
jgi:hypothetical protein